PNVHVQRSNAQSERAMGIAKIVHLGGIVQGRIDAVLDTLITKHMHTITTFAEYYFMSNVNKEVKSRLVREQWKCRSHNRSYYQQTPSDDVIRRLNKTQIVPIIINQDLNLSEWELYPSNNYIHGILLCISAITVWRTKIMKLGNNLIKNIMSKSKVTKDDINQIKSYLDLKDLYSNENQSARIILLLQHVSNSFSRSFFGKKELICLYYQPFFSVLKISIYISCNT
ncbi:unnamed protein product, partial [Didymodactylos carnosus]